MQDDGEIDQGVRDDVLLDTRQQLAQHVRAHQLWLLVDGCVAEPVTIGAIDVAAGRNLHKQLRNRLIMEGHGTWIISRHANTAMVGRNFTAALNSRGRTRPCETLLLQAQRIRLGGTHLRRRTRDLGQSRLS